jgi:hypothetical protein
MTSPAQAPSAEQSITQTSPSQVPAAQAAAHEAEASTTGAHMPATSGAAQNPSAPQTWPAAQASPTLHGTTQSRTEGW